MTGRFGRAVDAALGGVKQESCPGHFEQSIWSELSTWDAQYVVGHVRGKGGQHGSGSGIVGHSMSISAVTP